MFYTKCINKSFTISKIINRVKFRIKKRKQILFNFVLKNYLREVNIFVFKYYPTYMKFKNPFFFFQHSQPMSTNFGLLFCYECKK